MAKRKKKSLAVVPKSAAPSHSDFPAVSVIIPMYNAKAFIGECLDSLLLQTFADFEVIIVDDCSTDGSFKIVESYREKFGKRLKLSQTEKNSGGGGYVPRNIGLELASGEYVYFMDADDLILLTALETLYKAAKKYNADVVYFSGQYWLKQPDEIITYRDAVGKKFIKEKLNDEPILFVDKSDKILKEAILRNYHPTPWTKFVLRKLLTENKISFPEIIIGGDVMWTLLVCANSKRFLRLPDALYILQRYNFDSVIMTKRPSLKIEFDPNASLGYVKWFEELKKLAGKIKFLRENPELCTQAAKDFFEYFFRRFKEENRQPYIDDVYCILRRRLSAENNSGDFTADFLKLLNPERKIAETKPIKSTRAISVIIPLHNAETFIGECLDSLLAQTFRDFEVIVVDDCSTDNSYAIAESYAKKFDGRLKLTKTETNSDGDEAGNFGFSLAGGEYVFFMDADDALIPTALEELYALAKDNFAEVVYCEKYFTSEGVGQDFKYNMHIAPKENQESPFVDKPTFETTDMAKRIDKAINAEYRVTARLQFVRRDLLIENNIKFLSLIGSGDVGGFYQVLFCARRFLRVPNVLYIRRVHEESVPLCKGEVEHVHKQIGRTIRNLKYMENFTDKFAFFKERPEYRYKVLKHLAESDFARITDECENLEPFEVSEILRKKFGDYLGEHDILVSCICAELISERARIKRDERQISELKGELNHCKAKNTLAISIIIPIYNAEEYIGKCLESVLNQTFQNFEVIAVDDCSTDNSLAIVKNYAPKFNGMLKIVKTKKNSGGAGVPRNMGLNLASGEYVFFADADDFLLLNALETLYAAATKFDADVVYTSAYYNLKSENEVQKVIDDVKWNLFVEEIKINPNLPVNSPIKNMQNLLLTETIPACWRKFVKRKFLIENQIFFPEIPIGEDFIWTINLYCNANQFLQIPSALYFYRSYTPDSILRKKRTPAEQIFYRVSSFISWSRSLSDLAKDNAVLKEHPAYCHRALTLKFNRCVWQLLTDLNHLYYKDICEILCRELGNVDNPSDLTTLAFIFSNIIFEKRRISTLKKRVDELENEFVN